MTIQEYLEFMSACRERMEQLVSGAEERGTAFDETERAEFDTLRGWHGDAESQVERLRDLDDMRQRHPGAVDTTNTTSTNEGTRTVADPFDLSDMTIHTSGQDIRARALTAIERMAHLDDDLRAETIRKIERFDTSRGELAMRCLVTGSDSYRSAFSKMISGRQWALDGDERAALERAASLTTTAGGFAVPFTLDPTIVLTNDGTANPVRQIARQVTITTDQWNGVSTAGVTASWDGEAGEVSDDAPTLALPSIDVEKAQAFIPFSIEIGQDWVGFEADVRMLFADAKDRLEGTAFINGAGSGSNQPTGIIVELDGGSSEVAPGTAETFVLADVYKTLNVVPPRYRRAGRTAWIANIATINQIRQLAAAAGDRSAFNELAAGQPAQILGYDLYESSDMDSSAAIDAGATADNHILVVGDWQNYVIVDRVGMSVELVPHLFATANNRPSGQRGFYAWWRVGAGSVNDAAFRALNIATAA